jgi:hypothetical protein
VNLCVDLIVKMWRSTSSVSSRSSIPPDIVNSEQLSFESNDSFNFDKWNIPKISNKDIYFTSWLKSTWKSEYSVRTVEQTFAISGNNSTFQLFNKRFVNDSKNKEYKFLHVGSVQVAVKPLTRLGINASVLLCLRDARFVNFKTSILGMIQSSLFFSRFSKILPKIFKIPDYFEDLNEDIFIRQRFRIFRIFRFYYSSVTIHLSLFTRTLFMLLFMREFLYEFCTFIFFVS